MSKIRSLIDIMPAGAEGVYDCLAYLEPGLCLDVGAAGGVTAEAILKASPRSRVVAFEPFPGNFERIEKRLGTDSRVQLVKKAVSNHSRPMRFHVPWQGGDGYSAVGHLVSQTDPRSENSIEVPTTNIDAETDATVNFLKIDVQGQEYAVLDGAQKTFDRGVNLVLAEFMGDARVIQFLSERGYVIFDTYYLSSTPATAFGSGWNIVRTSVLSTGVKVPVMIPEGRPTSPAEYLRWFRDERGRAKSLWTDLLCVSPQFLPRFEQAVAAASTAGV